MAVINKEGVLDTVDIPTATRALIATHQTNVQWAYKLKSIIAAAHMMHDGQMTQDLYLVRLNDDIYLSTRNVGDSLYLGQVLIKTDGWFKSGDQTASKVEYYIPGHDVAGISIIANGKFGHPEVNSVASEAPQIVRYLLGVRDNCWIL